MILINENNSFQYEMEKVCRIFYPDEKIRTLKTYEETDETKVVHTKIENSIISVVVKVEEIKVEKSCVDEKTESEMQMARLLVKALEEVTGIHPSWGVLTGIRPSKLMKNEIDNVGREKAIEVFKERFLVDEKKAVLAADVSQREEKIIKTTSDKHFSLYISIPFCPSRCKYCSFVSHSIERTNKLIEPYIENLCKEIEVSGKIAKEIGITPDTVYFGGGTPTTLNEEQLKRILESVKNNFDLTNLKEYTVEAGRPDTVTQGKLELLKKYGVGRISINAQTFNDEVLQVNGRRHSVEEFYRAYEIARKVGFESINTDLIAGLQGDTLESFKNSIDSAIRINPENITVHTLSLKRSSSMSTDGEKIKNDAITVSEMVDYAQTQLAKNGYFPYYMYRQSKILGNLENVGWCKKGKECAYNIFMMEECSTVISCGAGAVTKLKEPDGNKLKRIFNFKYPYEYNKRFDEMIDRKNEILLFFDEYKK